MRLKVILNCAWTDLKAAPRRLFLSLTGVSLGLAAFLMVLALSLALENTIDQNFNDSTAVRRFEVFTRGINLGILTLDTSSIFGGESGISTETIEELRKLEQVAAVFPRLDVGLPMGAKGGESILGRSLYTELLLEGLPQEFLNPEEDYGDWTSDRPVPIWVSDKLVDIFNSTVAPSLKLPKLAPNLLIGFTFDLTIGRSLLVRNLKARGNAVLRAQVVGTHPSVSTLGAATTLKIARGLQQEWALEAPSPRYRSAIIDIKATRQLDATLAQLESLGLEADKRAERIRDMLKALKSFALLLTAVFLLLATLLVGQSFSAVLLERRRDLSLYRALGLSRLDMKLLIGAQGIALGLIGSTIGCVLALIFGELSQWALINYLPDFPFKPSTWFIWSGSAMLAALALGTVMTTLAGLWPLKRLTNERSLIEDLH